jgi:hypothetical protein
MVVPAHVPVIALSTAPGFPMGDSQQPIALVPVVEGISGLVYQEATRSGSPPSSADTTCQGGLWSFEGFEISRTPLESVT